MEEISFMTCTANPTLPVYMKITVYTKLGRLVRNTVIWPKSLCPGSVHGHPGKPCENGLTGKNMSWTHVFARVRETGPTSAKHTHLAKITVSPQCSWSPGHTGKKMSCNPTLPVYTKLGRLVRNTVIWPKSLCPGSVHGHPGKPCEN